MTKREYIDDTPDGWHTVVKDAVIVAVIRELRDRPPVKCDNPNCGETHYLTQGRIAFTDALTFDMVQTGLQQLIMELTRVYDERERIANRLPEG